MLSLQSKSKDASESHEEIGPEGVCELGIPPPRVLILLAMSCALPVASRYHTKITLVYEPS